MPVCRSPVLFLAALFVLSACNVNVKKDNDGENKNVDIKTPFGEIHVDKEADVRDTGLPVYAGARPKQKDNSGEEKSANVNISTSAFGLKVVALGYQSDDPPAKVAAYYQAQLKKLFGNVLECHTSHPGHYGPARGGSNGGADEELKCEGENSGSTLELKAGTRTNQHIVSIKPQGKGSEFALVYVRTRGKEDTI
ncbi:MAG: hypothetical protein JOZ14_03740 [Acidobacteria bacterium]|nr:hypothetical protein [Acidobacteriota bacterium]